MIKVLLNSCLKDSFSFYSFCCSLCECKDKRKTKFSSNVGLVHVQNRCRDMQRHWKIFKNIKYSCHLRTDCLRYSQNAKTVFQSIDWSVGGDFILVDLKSGV